MQKKSDKGFTMVELLVVMAILGILVAVGFPSFLRWLAADRVRSAAVTLKADMEAAKMRAIRDRVEVIITFSDGDGDGNLDRYTAFIDNGSGGGTSRNGVQDGSEATIFSRDAGDMSSSNPIKKIIYDPDYADDRIRFTSRGFCTDNVDSMVNNTLITGSGTTAAKKVTTNFMGRIYIESV